MTSTPDVSLLLCDDPMPCRRARTAPTKHRLTEPQAQTETLQSDRTPFKAMFATNSGGFADINVLTSATASYLAIGTLRSIAVGHRHHRHRRSARGEHLPRLV